MDTIDEPREVTLRHAVRTSHALSDQVDKYTALAYESVKSGNEVAYHWYNTLLTFWLNRHERWHRIAFSLHQYRGV